jgi:hypothetical protein
MEEGRTLRRVRRRLTSGLEVSVVFSFFHPKPVRVVATPPKPPILLHPTFVVILNSEVAGRHRAL